MLSNLLPLPGVGGGSSGVDGSTVVMVMLGEYGPLPALFRPLTCVEVMESFQPLLGLNQSIIIILYLQLIIVSLNTLPPQ